MLVTRSKPSTYRDAKSCAVATRQLLRCRSAHGEFSSRMIAIGGIQTIREEATYSRRLV